MTVDFSFVIIAFMITFSVVLVLCMFNLKRQIQRLSYQGDEKQKNSKQKNDQTGRRHSKPINWRVLLSYEIQRCLPDHKTEAMIRYRQLTGADVQDAEQTIAYHIAHPHQVPASFRHYELSDEQIASLCKLLRQGKRTEAHTHYQALTGVDQFATDVGLDILEQDILIQDEHFTTLREIADSHVDDADSDDEPQQILHTQQKG